MRLLKETTLEVGWRTWVARPPRPSLSVFVKATFALAPGALALADEQAPPEGERWVDDDVERALASPSEISLFKPRGEFFVLGACHPPDAPTARSHVAVQVGALQKSLAVVGDRSWRTLSDPETFVAMPFLVITVEGALAGIDRRYESAAASLGASRLTVVRRITLPMIAPSLRAGLVLAWARSLGEFGATITFAGNLQGRTQTLPLAVFVALESDRDTAVAISLVLVGISLVVLVALRDRWWSSR